MSEDERYPFWPYAYMQFQWYKKNPYDNATWAPADLNKMPPSELADFLKKVIEWDA